MYTLTCMPTTFKRKMIIPFVPMIEAVKISSLNNLTKIYNKAAVVL